MSPYFITCLPAYLNSSKIEKKKQYNFKLKKKKCEEILVVELNNK